MTWFDNNIEQVTFLRLKCTNPFSNKDEFEKICSDGELLASLESLDAHRNALSVRKKYFIGD